MVLFFVLVVAYLGVMVVKSIIELIKSYNNKRAWKIKLQMQLNRYEFGLISKEDLFLLLPRDFELWCAEFLKKLDYKILEVTSETIDGGKDIIAEKDNKKVYVECKKFNYEKNENHTEVSRDIVQKLVGAMIADNISCGIILTTGIVSEGSREYVKILPQNITVELIDGDELTNLYRTIREREHALIELSPISAT